VASLSPDGQIIGNPDPVPTDNRAANDLELNQHHHERWALPILFLFLLLGAGFGTVIPPRINNDFNLVSVNTQRHIQFIGTVSGASIGACTAILVHGFSPG
jgi:hypothetical protein